MKYFKHTTSLFLGLVLVSLTASAADTAYWEYRVRQGDNLWSFSERHLISPAYALRLRALNKITDPYHIRPDTILKVPFQWGKRTVASASVVAFTGKVNVIINGHLRTASVGLTLPAGARITTDKKSQVTLGFADGSQLVLINDTSIVLGKQTYYPTTGASHNEIELEQGSVKGEIQHPPLMNNRYEIKTRTAVTAVKGTELAVSIDEIGDTRTSVYSGVVDVSSGKQKVELSKGYGSLANDQSGLQKEELLPPPVLKTTAYEFNQTFPYFTWENLPQAKNYHIDLYKEGGKTNLVDVQQLKDHRVVLPINTNGSYTANISAISESGLLGIPSKVNFQVKLNPLPPILLGPKEGEGFFGKKIPLNLGKSAQYSAYLIEYSQDAKLAQDVQQQNINPNEKELIFTLPESGTWYWRIAGIDQKKQTGVFSPIQKLQVGTIKRGAPASLRAFAMNIPDMGYQLILSKLMENGETIIVYDNTRRTPNWELKPIEPEQMKHQYTAQVNYLFNGTVIFQTPKQSVNW